MQILLYDVLVEPKCVLEIRMKKKKKKCFFTISTSRRLHGNICKVKPRGRKRKTFYLLRVMVMDYKGGGTEAQQYVWGGAIPLQIHLHESEVTTLPPPSPALVPFLRFCIGLLSVV